MRRAQSSFAVILILIGFIALLTTTGFLDVLRWEALSTYWPALLIIAGVLYIIRMRTLGTVFALIAIVLFLTQNSIPLLPEIGETHTTDLTAEVQTGDVVRLVFSSADVDVFPGSSLNVAVTSNIDAEPTIKENRRRGAQEILVKTPPYALALRDYVNEWSVSLPEGVAFDLEIETGALHGDIDVRGLDVEVIDIDAGLFESTLKLDDKARNISVSSGAGDLEILVPESHGVRMLVDAGAVTEDLDDFTEVDGYYVNEAYNEGSPHTTVHVNSGALHVSVVQT